MKKEHKETIDSLNIEFPENNVDMKNTKLWGMGMNIGGFIDVDKNGKRKAVFKMTMEELADTISIFKGILQEYTRLNEYYKDGYYKELYYK